MRFAPIIHDVADYEEHENEGQKLVIDVHYSVSLHIQRLGVSLDNPVDKTGWNARTYNKILDCSGWEDTNLHPSSLRPFLRSFILHIVSFYLLQIFFGLKFVLIWLSLEKSEWFSCVWRSVVAIKYRVFNLIVDWVSSTLQMEGLVWTTFWRMEPFWTSKKIIAVSTKGIFEHILLIIYSLVRSSFVFWNPFLIQKLVLMKFHNFLEYERLF